MLSTIAERPYFELSSPAARSGRAVMTAVIAAFT